MLENSTHINTNKDERESERERERKRRGVEILPGKEKFHYPVLW